MTFLIHTIMVYVSFLLNILISFVKENFPGVTLHQVITIFLGAVIFQVLILALIDKINESFKEIFDEIELAIDAKDNEGIILWIEKYRKIPFLLKKATNKYKDTYFYNFSLHQKLQKELPQKTKKIKRTKI